ncbi:lytic transglycosylase domain-containing protein [Maritimibacter sp. HL-12]|uniref:lytic transglycosylase domain-containing protein n=1 Tax=Maritimibacter sp. HL-12 TaxID=1162418 RepID=UPI000A0F0585|nr:lytic transglycosylase domain-containing protein [Maritimibacter sp. HL-12]SMH53066.1 Soluble lytic murein transglycosylase and related regulatory proteins (some contain LysM/invasin domains) [Maritimibacter sp. HL-12]
MRGLATLLIGVALLVAAPLRAQTPEQPGGFTFKRIAAPPKGQGPKITVQVDPADYTAWMEGVKQPDGKAAVLPAAMALPAPSEWEWFWREVSADLVDAGPANLSRALATLDGAEAAPAPRLQALQDIAARFGTEILAATVGTDVSPALVVALIAIESSGRSGAESHAGAQGLMQLIPDTAARFGVDDANDPGQNIRGGVAYLAWLMKHFDRDPILALAGYNAGENAVTKHGGVPPFAETRAYVPKVLNAWRVARGLCRTPPELITDGCVFTVQG